jgi:hypothetical protein
MLREIMARIAAAFQRYKPTLRDRRTGGERPARRAPALFSREQREAARRRAGGGFSWRGTHGGRPQDAGFGKDDEARPHD